MFTNCTMALVTPKGITKNSYNPQRALNVVLGMSPGFNGIYQYLDLNSILVNTLASPAGQTVPQAEVKCSAWNIVMVFYCNG